MRDECPVKNCEEEAKDLLMVNDEAMVKMCRRHKLELLSGKKLKMVFQKAPGDWKGYISG